MNLYGVAGMDILSYSSARLTSVYAPDGGYQNVLKEYINNAWSSYEYRRQISAYHQDRL